MKNFLLIGFLPLLLLSACDNDRTKHNDDDDLKSLDLTDRGPAPFVFDVEGYTMANNSFRKAIWTGVNMQMTLMSLQPGEEIGLELHREHDQFIRVEKGMGTVYMGDSADNLDFVQSMRADEAVFIPAGKWHNLVNTGTEPIKLYSIYAPIEHDHDTEHVTAQEAHAAESAAPADTIVPLLDESAPAN